MSVADAKTILQGGSTAATNYFSSKTRDPLGQKFLPVITQATANDLLRCAMRELERLGWGIVLTVHDEIVIECPTERAEEAREALARVMCAAPDWASGLPLAVETKVMSRYGKG
jgi:DNA polymerase